MFVPLIRWGVGAATAVFLPLVLLGQQQQKTRHPEVTELTLSGVKAVDEGELRQSLATEASRCRSILLIPVCRFTKAPAFYERAYLDRDELARDMIRARVFYFLRGYREATVDTVVRPAGRNAVRVTFAVHEGAPTLVSDVQVTQQKVVLSPAEVKSRVRVAAGQPLNIFDVDTSRVQLRNRLWDKGYADAIVDTSTVIDSVARRAVVKIDILPRWVAHVASIDVVGNQDIPARTILRSLSLRPGDVYRRSNVLESQRALYASNLFRRASIQVERRDSLGRTDSLARHDSLGNRDSSGHRDSLGAGLHREQRDSLKHLLVAVQEAPPRLMRVSAGFNTVDFVQLEGRFTNYNWFGDARQLNTLVTVGNLLARQLNGNGIFYDVSQTVVGAGQGKYFLPTFEASGEVQQRWVGSPRNTIALSAFTHRRISPGIFVDRGFGGGATFTRLLGPRSPASVSYRFEVTNVDASDVYFCVSSGVCDAATLDALRKNQKLSPVAVTVSKDLTDDPYEPRRGYRGQIDAEHASSFTLSDFRYDRVSNEEAMFLPIGHRSVLGGHIRLGYVNALRSTAQAVGVDELESQTERILHPRKRFYLGGASSVRGFAENQLGPRVLTISPQLLRGNVANASTAMCPPATPLAQCNPNAAYISNNDFDPRPLGGNALAEGSVEYRFPVLFNDLLGAVFVDAGYLSQNTNPTLARSAAAVTPGFGARYLSPAGPIRVDLGINPKLTEDLPVITEDVVNGQRTLITLNERRRYQSGHGILSRLMLHLAIGEAF